MRSKKWWLLAPLILLIAYLMGPHPRTPEFNQTLPPVPGDLTSLEGFIREKESQHTLRPDNQARIVWSNDSIRQKTEFAILYLHGFSASQGEGDPVHRNIAKRFGCNLYLSRLAEHGIDTSEQLVNFTADKMWESAKEAFAIASTLGKKVIVMGTSTGGTLALILAARYPQVHAVLLLSPNVEIFDGNAWLLNDPWGLQIAKLVTGSPYVVSADTRPDYKRYWNFGYRLEAVVELQEMLETTMRRPLFEKVKQPLLMLYYYRDPIHQDSVVKVDAMQKMFAELGTPASKKRSVAMPLTGNHVLGSSIKSADVDGVSREVSKFMNEVVGIK